MTTHLGSWTIYSQRRKRQKRKPLKERSQTEITYIIPTRRRKVKPMAGYTLSDGQLQLRPLE